MEENKEFSAELENEAEAAAEEKDETAAEAVSEDVNEAEEAPKENTPEADESSDDSEENADGGKKSLGKKILNDVLDIAESTLTTVFVMIMILTYLLHPVSVDGNSMNPTLENGDRIFITTVYTKLKYGDIIIINNDAVFSVDDNGNAVEVALPNNPLDECIIKRVIAAGGQTIDIDNSDADRNNWKVIVDGKVLDEPYVADTVFTSKSGFFAEMFPFTVPEGYYFVMGDNRTNSSDSRSGYVGLISKEQVYGKALVRYAPFNSFKFLFNSYKKSAND